MINSLLIAVNEFMKYRHINLRKEVRVLVWLQNSDVFIPNFETVLFNRNF